MRNGLFYSGHQEQIESCGIVVHRHDNDSPVAGDRQVLRMSHIVAASIGGDNAERLERLLLPQSLNLLNRHAEIIAKKSPDLSVRALYFDVSDSSEPFVQVALNVPHPLPS